MPDPRYIDGAEYAARLCDALGLDYRTEPYPGHGKDAAAARACAYAIRARLVRMMGTLRDVRMGDPLLSVRQSQAMSALRQRSIELPTGHDHAEQFLSAMQEAAGRCDETARDEAGAGRPAIRRCAAAIRSQACVIAEGWRPLEPHDFEALRRTRPEANETRQGDAAA